MQAQLQVKDNALTCPTDDNATRFIIVEESCRAVKDGWTSLAVRGEVRSYHFNRRCILGGGRQKSKAAGPGSYPAHQLIWFEEICHVTDRLDGGPEAAKSTAQIDKM